MLIRTNTIYRGLVQGVCFRATAQEIARGLAISGFVRNLPDGSVELEAQGEAEQVELLLNSIARRYDRNIRDVSTRPSDLREEDSGFRISH